MSRIGKKPITIPSGVTVTASGSTVAVKGPKGELKLAARSEVGVKVEGGAIVVTRLREERDRQARAYHGMTRSILEGMVIGVSQGYEKKLEINGVGYGAKLEGKTIVLTLGFAHPVKVPVPSDVSVEVPNPTTILLKGCDKQKVGQLAASIRKLRKPEPYKGKGIKYENEVVRRKAGKAFGSA
jgi:large subunit ribosomal protein L6